MQPDVQIFTFQLPGLEETFALTLPEVLSVVDSPAVTPVPFVPPAVMGVCVWQQRLLCMLELAALVSPAAAPSPVWSGHAVVTQFMLGPNREVVAWPVKPGAVVRTLPAQAPTAPIPEHLNGALVHAALLHDGLDPVYLLRLDNLKTVLTGSAAIQVGTLR
ncbi:MAG: hypothetical protein GYB64_05405 [Chloroflexi bacterium]|nr:hypothetical protein [Chloroflexota bacterium]